MRFQSISSLSHAQLVLALVVIGYFVLMFGNGFVALTDPDEVFYTQTAVEMVKHQSWLTPYIFDHPQFEKPILCYWLMALATKFFGPGPFVERFWPAAFGILGLLVTYGISWLLFENKRTAFLSSLVLGTSFIYIALSRAVLTDMVFSVLVTAAIGCFYFAYKFPKRKQTGILGFFVFSAVAVLAKGLLGFVFPTLTVCFFLAVRRQLGFVRCGATLLGFVLFLVIALPWHVLMFQLYGSEFFQEYFNNVHVRRIFEAEHRKSDTWYFYPLTMIGGTFPWVFFFVPALIEMARQVFRGQSFRSEIVFLISWVLAVFVVLQPAHSKLASYIFPVFPALAIFIAYFLEVNLETPGLPRKMLRIGGYAFSLVLVGAGAAALIVGPRFLLYVGSMTPLYVAAGLTASLGVTIFYLLRRDHLARGILLASVMPGILITGIFLVRPHVEPWVSCRVIGQALNELARSDTTVLASKFYARGVRFYTQRKIAVININGKGYFSPHPIPFLNSDEKVLSFLASQPKTFCVVRRNDLSDLKRIAQKGGYTLQPVTGQGGRFIVTLQRDSSPGLN